MGELSFSKHRRITPRCSRLSYIIKKSSLAKSRIMSDEEYYEEEEGDEEEEDVEEEEEEEDEDAEEAEKTTNKSVRSEKISENEGDGSFLKARQEAKKGELDEQLREYINEWRKQRSKEEDELQRLKEKQAKRKEIRAEQEKKLAQQKKEEEDRFRKEEAERKRQAMMQVQKDKQQASGGKGGGRKADGGMSNVRDARREMTKTKEQLEEEKRISLSIRIKPLDVDSMDSDQLMSKAAELWDTIVRLETEKYDLEERQKRQDYDLKELKERQKQQLRQKAMKKGLDPEALTGKY